MLEQEAHGATVERTVGLGARSPDCRAFGAIQHPELNRGAIGSAAHQPAEDVDLADDGTLRDTTDGGIAGHLPDRVEDGSEQQSPGA